MPSFYPHTRVILDSTPLGKLARPTPDVAIAAWRRIAEARFELIVPEITDYEVRRELLRARLLPSVRALDDLHLELTYLPITTTAMLLASELWADARQRGRSTAEPIELLPMVDPAEILNPYWAGMVARIKAKETLDAVAADVAAETGLSAEEVSEYVRDRVKRAKAAKAAAAGQVPATDRV